MQPTSPLLLLLPLLLCLTASAKTVPTRTVDLDAPAYERWRQIAAEYGPAVRAAIREALDMRTPAHLAWLVRLIARDAHRFLNEPYRSELAGFAHYGNVSIGDLVALQLMYDATAYCTSIVCVDANSTVWHARNFDYGMNPLERQFLRRLTLNVRFLRGGKRFVLATMVTGYLGFHSAMRPDGFSVTLNQRDNGTFEANLAAAIKMVFSTGRLRPVGFVFRTLMETAPDYDSVVRQLAETPLIAPGYFIVGGRSGDQGAVITRGRSRSLDVFRLDAAAGRWFVLETNYDRWLPVPPSDDRRGPARKAMQRMGRANITTDALFAVLFTPPVRNSGTIFSMVMSASRSVYQVVIT